MHRTLEADSDRTAPRAVSIALALAALLVACNLVSPVHIDDPFIGEIAQRLLDHPGDPYGFEIFWVQWPQPVHEELTPPVVPYWWALGLALFGARVWAIKLWFAPFVVALALGMLAVLRRVAPGAERPFLVLALLSPAVAPSVNLMQDIPAYGLAVGGVALYLAAAAARGARGDRLALGAGVALGAALQTKYPVATFVAAVALHGVLLRRMRRSTIATVVALLVFGGWELYGEWRYGQGMFAGQLGTSMYWVARGEMLVSLVRLLGGALGAVAIAGLLALGVPRAAALGLGAAGLAGYLALTLAPVGATLFVALGLALLTTLALAAWRLGRGVAHEALESRLVSWWLLLWFGGELIGFFLTAPFPAARRVIGPTLVATLLVARLWSAAEARASDVAARRRALGVVVIGSALVGLVYVAIDTLEARAQRDAVAAVARAIEPARGGRDVWYAGHWGFGEHARRAGWRPLVPDRTTLEPGDWLVVPRRVDRQSFRLEGGAAERRFEIELPPRLPLATLPGFYAGDVMLEHLAGPRIRVDVSRVRQRTQAVTDWPTRRLTDYVLRSPPGTAAAAYPALAARMVRGAADDRRLAAMVLSGQAGPRTPALVAPFVRALGDREPTVRRDAASALGRIGAAARVAEPALRRVADDDSQPEVRAAAAAALRSLAAD